MQALPERAGKDTVATVTRALALYSRPDLMSPVLANPALGPWRHTASLSRIGASASHVGALRQACPEEGSGSNGYLLDASTYMHIGEATVTGNAGYSNRRIFSPLYNETEDPGLLYPYLTADTVGGNLSSEHYFFSGSYALEREKWSWGASLGYRAGQTYRRIDPRPRDITGMLTAELGASYGIASGYILGAGFRYRHYYQSCNILFRSDMGKTKVFHMTGLGTHYDRFAGAADNSSYSGNMFTGRIDLIPRCGHGLFASASASDWRFTKYLKDLNNLDMAYADETSFSGILGWSACASAAWSWQACVTAEYRRRKGVENIFGDPSTNIYPKIGALELYHDFHTGLGGGFLVEWSPAPMKRVTLEGSACYRSRHTEYLSPLTETSVKGTDISARLYGIVDVGRHMLVESYMSARFFLPSGCSATLVLPDDADTDPAERLFRKMEIDRYMALSAPRQEISPAVAGTYAISSRYAVRLSLTYIHTHYSLSSAQKSTADSGLVSLGFLF